MKLQPRFVWLAHWSVILLLVGLGSPLLHADALDDFARDFWAWRAAEQPISSDDIPRLERPGGWLPDWSPGAVERYRTQLAQFQARWQQLEASRWPVARQVDYRLMGSALARVRWELDINRAWQRNPVFYLDQTVGGYFDLLLPPPPFDAARTRDIVKMLGSIPQTLEYARQNLTAPAAPFASLALGQLQDVRPRLLKSLSELKPVLDAGSAAGLDAVTERAIAALEAYRAWLTQRITAMTAETAVGREAYVFFLKNVALLPYTPEELLRMGRAEWARSVAFESYEARRDQDAPQLAMFKTQAELIAGGEKDELAIRSFLESRNILTIPAGMAHYRYAPIPGYLAPLAGIGEEDDFTGPSRLKEDSTRYIYPPSPDLGYFALATAKDPRPDMVHEGVPGHYFQLALSWAHPDPIRRHYYDSGANEGLGFYAEEMMLEAGLFDDSPRTREVVYNFMRLRALRVEVDVKLALGQFTIDQAAEYLHATVPMDTRTARGEAASFASAPGQAITYQIGKLQILAFLADARRHQAEGFKLRGFHDFLWLNGNVPIVLQRWEYLGDKGEVEQLDRLQ